VSLQEAINFVEVNGWTLQGYCSCYPKLGKYRNPNRQGWEVKLGKTAKVYVIKQGSKTVKSGDISTFHLAYEELLQKD